MQRSISRSAVLTLLLASIIQLAHGQMGAGYSPYGYGGSSYKIPGANLYPDTSYNTYNSLGVFSYNTQTGSLYNFAKTDCPKTPERISGDFTFLCCNQRPVLSLLDPEDVQCCGDTAYDPATSICCGTTAFPAPIGNRLSCCGDVPYNRTAQVCCGGKLFPAEFGDASACCGIPKYVNYTTNVPTQFSMLSQVCCLGTITNLTDVFQMDLNDIFRQFGDDIASKVGCCKEVAFSTLDQKCCANDVKNITGNPKAVCCRSDVINPDTDICCNGFVFGNTTNKCCGVNSYDPTTSKCCGGYPSPSPGGENDPNYSCCGILPYNNQYQTCCSGVIINTPSYNQKCCGFKPYDKTTSICCDEEYIVKKGTSCYEKSYQPY